ncbi:TRAP transporter, partial [Phormidium willei BDU 130791]
MRAAARPHALARALAVPLLRLSDGLNRVAVCGALLALVVMVGATGWQVVARYLLAAPPPWTEELARYAMIWGGMLGASIAFKAWADPTLFPGGRRLRGAAGGLLALLRAAGVLLIAVPVLWHSVIGPGGGFARSFLARTAMRDTEVIGVAMV